MIAWRLVPAFVAGAGTVFAWLLYAMGEWGEP